MGISIDLNPIFVLDLRLWKEGTKNEKVKNLKAYLTCSQDQKDEWFWNHCGATGNSDIFDRFSCCHMIHRRINKN